MPAAGNIPDNSANPAEPASHEAIVEDDVADRASRHLLSLTICELMAYTGAEVSTDLARALVSHYMSRDDLLCGKLRTVYDVKFVY